MGKIIVMGPGRCGTTFTIRLLKNLGLDTGGYLEIFREIKHEELTADFRWPRVLKGTGTLCASLNKWVSKCNWDVDVVFLCVRELESNIQSMLNFKQGKGVYKSLTAEVYESRIRREVEHSYKIARHQIATGGYRFTEIEFPKSVFDIGYCYSKFKFVEDFKFGEFQKAWNLTVQPKKVRF